MTLVSYFWPNWKGRVQRRNMRERCDAESNNLHACANDNQWEWEQPRGDTPHRIDFTFQSCCVQMEGCWEINKGGMMVEEETEQEDRPAEETQKYYAKGFPVCYSLMVYWLKGLRCNFSLSWKQASRILFFFRLFWCDIDICRIHISGPRDSAWRLSFSIGCCYHGNNETQRTKERHFEKRCWQRRWKKRVCHQ